MCCTFAKKLTVDQRKASTPSKEEKKKGKEINKTVNLNRTPAITIARKKKSFKGKDIIVSQFNAQSAETLSKLP